MSRRLRALYHELRLRPREAWLRHQRRAAFRRLGDEVVRSGANGGDAEVERLASKVGAGLARLETLRQESRATLEADRADAAAVPAWVRPVVMLRGVCARLVLRYRRASMLRELGAMHETIGELAAQRAEFWYPMEREASEIGARLSRVQAERELWVAPYGTTALPAWSGRLAAETLGFGRAVGRQLRGQLLPKAPAIAGLLVGWWIADTYTDSHLRSALRSLGIGSGGTRVLSSSTLQAMSFWLPLLAAALCGYLGERIAAFYAVQERTHDEAPAGR